MEDLKEPPKFPSLGGDVAHLESEGDRVLLYTPRLTLGGDVANLESEDRVLLYSPG